MKKLFILMAAVAIVATGCKGGSKGATAGNESKESAPEKTADQVETPSTAPVVDADAPFTFDELFKIFSIFGDNIMSKYYASQSIKDSIKEELKDVHDTREEFLGKNNFLTHTTFDGDCYHGTEMACYRYKADGHILVLLLENSGCEAPVTEYIRAYEYDPETGNAVERELPFNPMPSYNDFNDILRMAGADVNSLRKAAKKGIFDYNFSFDGMQVWLHDPYSYDEGIYNGDLSVDYKWNGAEFVRDTDQLYECIHSDGLGSITLGEQMPDITVGGDPNGYNIEYSDEAGMWLVRKGDLLGLEIQVEDGDVWSIEVRFPKYAVSGAAYEGVNEQPHPGGLISDCIEIGDVAPVVYVLPDGTISIEDEIWNSKIAFLTTSDALKEAVEPSPYGPSRIIDPKFKPTARIQSIRVWRD